MILEGIYKGSFPEDDGTVHKSNLIFDSIVYINRNLDKKLTEENIAREFGVSYSHFSREFKKATGRTFKDYIVDTRMNHAEQLLVNTDLQVSEIAASCGYSNISYFISLYKKIKGKTPLKERKESEKRA
jgi:iron complex transport system substrate-binding protein